MTVVLVCSSCEVEFDFSDLDDGPILDVKCSLNRTSGLGTDESASQDAVTFMTFVSAVPSAAGEREFSEELTYGMDIYHDGRKVWSDEGVGIGYSSSGSFEGVEPGDQLQVVVSAEGFPEASAVVTMPPDPPRAEVSHKKINDYAYRIMVTIEDDPLTEDWYSFSFYRASFPGGEPIQAVIGTVYLDISFADTEEASYLDSGPFDVVWNGQYGVSDAGFNGQRKTFEVNADYPMVSPEAAVYSYYRVVVENVSPELIRYNTALWNRDNNMLGFMGLAPADFAYTNVVGGTGYVACRNKIFTDWIPLTSD